MDNRVTICACASRSFIDKDKIAEIATALGADQYQVEVVPDFCWLAMKPSAEITAMASGVIIACHERAIQGHLHRLGIEGKRIIDMRSSTAEEVLAQLGIAKTDAKATADGKSVPVGMGEDTAETGTDAWYPVIDKNRCTECGKCHDFCLFGVYSVVNKQVRVSQPQNCKNNCPACARLCPSQAVIFPKYEKSPINGGTDIEESFDPEEMDKMYSERLRMKLQQRRAGIGLTPKRKT